MQQLTSRAARLHGFTLLEVMIAAVILVVALVGSLALTVGLLRGNQTTRARDTAYFLAQETLDQYASTPLSLFPGLTSAAPSAPTCYSEGDDETIDRPMVNAAGVTCGPGIGSAYWVRTWACCAPPVAGGLFNLPNPVPAVLPTACALGGAGFGWQAQFTTMGVAVPPTPATSATCVVAVEVTWPIEPAGGAAALFQDSSSVAPVFSFQNHVFATMVRSQ